MKNLKIEVPEGYEIDEEKSTFENVVFKKKDSEKEKEAKFLELCNGLRMFSNPDDENSVLFKNEEGEIILEIENDKLLVDYGTVWSVFKYNFNMYFDEIQELIKTQVEKHFNWEGLTPRNGTRKTVQTVEKHFNWEGLTPTIKASDLSEKHFNWEDKKQKQHKNGRVQST